MRISVLNSSQAFKLAVKNIAYARTWLHYYEVKFCL